MIIKIKRLLPFVIAGIVLLGLILAGYSFSWTGFASTTTPNSDFQPGKTLWDWLQLIFIPVALFFLAQWYSQAQGKAERERQRVNEQYQLVQTFFDRIQALVLDKNLLQTKSGDASRTIARALTLTVLEQIDGERKSAIVHFLDELKLIQGSSQKVPVISLTGANLSGLGAPIGAAFSNFVGADLKFADLRHAKLDVGNLSHANLMGADVTGASFVDCNFRSANFQVVGLEGVNLYGAAFDFETVLPNGQYWNNTDMTKFGAVLIPPITEEEGREIRRELGYPDEDEH